MEYIKRYNLELYNHMVTLHLDHKEKYSSIPQRPPFFKRKLGKFLKKYFPKKPSVFPSELAQKIKDDSLVFMNINKNNFDAYAQNALTSFDNTPHYNNQTETDLFWQKKIDKNWLCLNLLVQTSWYRIYI